MPPQLSWLEPGESLPPPERAWGLNDPAPGLLAAGGTLSVVQLRAAYHQGSFPWFSEGQPILWWSPDPRMVLKVSAFKLHRSLRKTLQTFRTQAHCEIRIDFAFPTVIAACASHKREGQHGTWIVPDMVEAYTRLHAVGDAHSIETWVDGKLVGGLYCVALGQAVFGESMFAHVSDASKIALSALVALCRQHSIDMIDCQQNTQHLASLGATEMPRAKFLQHVSLVSSRPGVPWIFEPSYWNTLLPTCDRLA